MGIAEQQTATALAKTVSLHSEHVKLTSPPALLAPTVHAVAVLDTYARAASVVQYPDGAELLAHTVG
jgi:hypothetical protein